MPTSPNRRRIEIPAALYTRLEVRARRDGQTIAGLVATLLADALDAAPGGAAGAQTEGAGAQELRASLRQVLHNDALQLRELQFVQQRLDLALRVLVAGHPAAEGDPCAAPDAGQAARQRLAEALTEHYVAVPHSPGTPLAQSGEPRPAQARTLWRRPQRAADREESDDSTE